MSSCFTSDSINTEIGEVVIQACFNNNQLSTVNVLVNGISYTTSSQPIEGTFYNGTLQYGGQTYGIQIYSAQGPDTYYSGIFTEGQGTGIGFGFTNFPTISKGPSKSYWWLVIVIIIILLIIYLIWRSKNR